MPERDAGRAAGPGPAGEAEHAAAAGQADPAAPDSGLGQPGNAGARPGQGAGPADPPRPSADPAARAQLAREALLAAKADSAARGNWPGRQASRAAGEAPGPGAGTRRRQRREDPETLNSAIAGLIDARGWQLAAAAGSVFGRWEQIVGPELAAHTRPDGLADGELSVTADSTAWATQVRLLAATLVRRVNAELGDGAVKRVKVRGPAAPRRPGQWRSRDSRGPRDTYG